MAIMGPRNIKRATKLYWFMLILVFGIVIWWFIVLEKQNIALARFQEKQLKTLVDSTHSPLYYQTELHKISNIKKRNTFMYISEGLFFLSLIIMAAIIVYRSVWRQLRLQLQQQNFTMAVTHELKTPLSVARLNLETIQKYNLDPEKQERLLKNTLEEINRLNTLTNNILISSQLEAGGYQVAKEELDFSDLVKDSLQQFRVRYPDRLFEENIEEDIDLEGDALLLQMMVNNLVENAVKYSPKNKTIKAALQKKEGSIVLNIIDEGSGIEESEKDKIFTRFYRVGNESTRRTQGTGLGLWLCKIIAKDHNGDIFVTNNSPSGSNFAVHLY